MSDSLMIYGATGYSGKLLVHAAMALGMRPVLGGRDDAKLAALAEPRGLQYRCAHLGDADGLRAALRDIVVVLHAAGPFSETARPMVDACLYT